MGSYFSYPTPDKPKSYTVSNIDTDFVILPYPEYTVKKKKRRIKKKCKKKKSLN